MAQGNPPPPVQHIRTTGAGEKICHLLQLALPLVCVPCTQQRSGQPVPVGWCQLVLCTLSRGNGVSCGCPAHQLPAAAVTHAAGFLSQPLAPPGLPRPLPPFLGREGCEKPSLSWPCSPAIAVLLVCRHLPAPHCPDPRAGGTGAGDGSPAWPQSSCCSLSTLSTLGTLGTLSTGTCLQKMASWEVL